MANTERKKRSALTKSARYRMILHRLLLRVNIDDMQMKKNDLSEDHEIFAGFDVAMAEYEKRWPAPKCHFTPMFKDESDCGLNVDIADIQNL